MTNEPALVQQEVSRRSTQLGFVTCATDASVLARRLLASPCIASGAASEPRPVSWTASQA